MEKVVAFLLVGFACFVAIEGGKDLRDKELENLKNNLPCNLDPCGRREKCVNDVTIFQDGTLVAKHRCIVADKCGGNLLKCQRRSCEDDECIGHPYAKCKMEQKGCKCRQVWRQKGKKVKCGSCKNDNCNKSVYVVTAQPALPDFRLEFPHPFCRHEFARSWKACTPVKVAVPK